MIKNLLKKIINSNNIEQQTNSSYWSRHNVTSHKKFSSIDESLNYLQWRNDQYYNYEKYMPTHSFDDKRILDYGCGPGHDLVGFGVNSKPKELIGIDVSPVSLSEAGHRINLHNINAELILLDENENNLPFEDHSFDYVHSSGVLHHVQDPVSVLKEIKRVLKIDGKIRMMLYNYDSIWLHLYVAYHRNIIQGLYPDKDIREQFSHSTDGEDCPISNVYKYHEWIDLCARAGLNCKFIDAAISMHEMSILPTRFDAIQNVHLRSESRAFLAGLSYDRNGYPMHNNYYAGIDACYEARID